MGQMGVGLRLLLSLSVLSLTDFGHASLSAAPQKKAPSGGKPSPSPRRTREEIHTARLAAGLNECRQILAATAPPIPAEHKLLYSPLAFQVFKASPLAQNFAAQILGRPLRMDNGLETHNEFLDFTGALIATRQEEQTSARDLMLSVKKDPGPSVNRLVTTRMYIEWLRRIQNTLDPEEQIDPTKVGDSFLAKHAAKHGADFFDPKPREKADAKGDDAKPPLDPLESSKGKDAPDRWRSAYEGSEIQDHLAEPGHIGINFRTTGVSFSQVMKPQNRKSPLINRASFPQWLDEIDRHSPPMVEALHAIESHIIQGTKPTVDDALVYLTRQRILVWILAKAFFESLPDHEQARKIQGKARSIFIQARKIGQASPSPLGSSLGGHPYPELTGVDTRFASPERYAALTREVGHYKEVRQHLNEILEYRF